MVDVLILTIYVNVTATILGMLIGMLFGYRLYFSNNRFKEIFVYFTKTMMGLPPVVLGLVLFMILKNDGALGFLSILYTPTALIIAQTILIIPIVTGNVYQLLCSKGKVLFFTLDMFNISFFKKIKYSILEFKNELIFILILGFSRAVSEVGAVMIVGGNIKNHTRIMTTALANLKSMGNYNEALLYGAILIAIAFIVQFILSLLSKEQTNENF